MKLPRFILERSGALALALNGVLGLAMAISSLVYFNSRPEPAYETGIGSVTIDLAQLNHGLQFEHLQQAGLFANIKCRHCDFSRSRTRRHLRVTDFSDIGLMGVLYLGTGREVMWLHFYGTEIPAGQQRLAQSIRALHTRFPGREDAIRWQKAQRGRLPGETTASAVRQPSPN